MDVGALLDESRAAHAEYRSFCGRTINVGGQIQTHNGDPVQAAAALERAGLARRAAHDADPDMTDPAWSDPAEAAAGGDAALLTFYAEIGARPEHAERLQVADVRQKSRGIRGE